MRRGLFLFLVLFVAVSMSSVGSSAQDATPSADASTLATLGLPELVITVTADGFSAPAEVAAGLTLVTVDNQSEGFGEAQFVQIPDGVTQEEVRESLASEDLPEWFHQAVWAGAAVAMPGTQGRAVINLNPGEWAILNTDSETAMAPAKLTVTGEAQEVAPDAVPADLQVELGAYMFNFPDEVAAGPQVWEVTNTHTVPHHVVLLSYPEPVTVEQVEDTLQGDMTGTPGPNALDFKQVEDAGYVGVLSGGQTMWVELDAPPGNYIALCFISDEGSETPHAAMGMIDTFTVK